MPSEKNPANRFLFKEVIFFKGNIVGTIFAVKRGIFYRTIFFITSIVSETVVSQLKRCAL